jgi:uncharacterized iron-regulated membrane protein
MRTLWTTLHRWMGLSTALFLIISGLTGAVISWDHEIDGWLNSKLYDTGSRGPFRNPFELAAAVEAHDPRARVAYLPLGFEEGHAAGYFVQPRQDPATGRPYQLGYNQVFVDPVTAEVRGKRDSTAVSLKPETLMPFLRKLHYTLHVPAMWGSDRVGQWIMGGIALVWLLDSFVGLYLTMPRRLRQRAGAETVPHRDPAGWWSRWKPSWLLRWKAGGYKLNFDLHRAGGLWAWGLIIVVAFTSFSINLNREIFFPLLSMVSKTTPGPSTLVPRLERVDEHRRHVETALLGDLLEAGRAGDVDLGQHVADDVQSHQQQPARSQRRAQRLCDFQVACRQRLRHALAAGGQVAAHLAALRDARQAVGHRLAADDQHALVALGDLGHEALHHQRGGAHAVQGLGDGAEVQAVGLDAEDAGAAHAVERLQDDVVVLGVEAAHLVGVARHQRRADELRELHHRQLLRVVAQRRRLVEHAAPSRSACSSRWVA